MCVNKYSDVETSNDLSVSMCYCIFVIYLLYICSICVVVFCQAWAWFFASCHEVRCIEMSKVVAWYISLVESLVWLVPFL